MTANVYRPIPSRLIAQIRGQCHCLESSSSSHLFSSHLPAECCRMMNAAAAVEDHRMIS